MEDILPRAEPGGRNFGFEALLADVAAGRSLARPRSGRGRGRRGGRSPRRLSKELEKIPAHGPQ
jgi:hypothetical protein